GRTPTKQQKGEGEKKKKHWTSRKEGSDVQIAIPTPDAKRLISTQEPLVQMGSPARGLEPHNWGTCIVGLPALRREEGTGGRGGEDGSELNPECQVGVRVILRLEVAVTQAPLLNHTVVAEWACNNHPALRVGECSGAKATDSGGKVSIPSSQQTGLRAN
ncbi:hypothetical protein BaRGS_00027722, partial [Batillaria attramentaria]